MRISLDDGSRAIVSDRLSEPDVSERIDPKRYGTNHKSSKMTRETKSELRVFLCVELRLVHPVGIIVGVTNSLRA